MHTSQFSMGVDIADVTNDGFPEIMSTDMLPNDPYILKRHQEIFYNYLKIKSSDPLEVKAAALLKLTF